MFSKHSGSYGSWPSWVRPPTKNPTFCHERRCNATSPVFRERAMRSILGDHCISSTYEITQKVMNLQRYYVIIHRPSSFKVRTACVVCKNCTCKNSACEYLRGEVLLLNAPEEIGLRHSGVSLFYVFYLIFFSSRLRYSSPLFH